MFTFSPDPSFQGTLGIVSSSLLFYLFYKGGRTDKNLLASAGMLMGIVPVTIFHLIPVATPLLEDHVSANDSIKRLTQPINQSTQDVDALDNLYSYGRRHFVRIALTGGAFYTLLFRPIKH
jgi:hypothetical protein